MSTLLLDGDGFGFTAFDFKTGAQDLAVAKSQISKYIDTYYQASGCNNLTIFLGGKGNWRNDIYPLYKANRTASPKPPMRGNIMSWLREEYDTMSLDGYEADDLIAYYKRISPNNVVCSNDKDIVYGLEGRHMKTKFGEFMWYDSTEYNAKLFNYAQLLMGDKADNIPSAIVKPWVKALYPNYAYKVGKGYGEKTAYHVLTSADTRSHNRWSVCKQILLESNINPDIQVNLVRLGIKKEHVHLLRSLE